jgi:NADH:ubiquinone oxidoreductase subunit 6 (subunit J)
LLLTISFFICAAVSIGGALLAALTGSRARRVTGLFGVAIGTAAMLALLSAGFAALVELVAVGASALLIGLSRSPEHALLTRDRPQLAWPAQLAAAGCALLFALFVYAAWRGGVVAGSYPGGLFNSAAVARLLLDRDGLAGVALGGILLTALAGAAASWRVRRR